MAHRIAVSELNASTVDILNVIRENASLAYQNNVPEVESVKDIPRVGEVIYGTAAFSNEFINALVNRIALVRVRSATFNNPYERLKKGYLDYGETVEDIFVQIANVFEFSQEKAEGRELKQYKPNVKSAFHAMNWRVLYPVSIADEELKRAFLSAEGVTDLIARIVDSIYTGANYDEYLLFKYMLIKAATSGQFAVKGVDGTANMANYAKAFRGTSNMLPFMKREFNIAGVQNTTPKDRQVIFMDAQFNADFDVDVLASAFNMDKADFMGSLFLIDDWTTFDNDRWSVIRENSDGIGEVTDGELALMENVKAIILDEDWFQIYDNLNKFTEKYVAAGLRWNYFYHTWKTISFSPFANAVLFVDNDANIEAPETLNYVVSAINDGDNAKIITLMPSIRPADMTLADKSMIFEQDEDNTGYGIAVQPYGVIFVPHWTGNILPASTTIYGHIGTTKYSGSIRLSTDVGGPQATKVGDTITFTIVD